MAKGKKLSQLELKSKQTITSAKKDFGTTINGYPIKWKITSDDAQVWIVPLVEIKIRRCAGLDRSVGFRVVIMVIRQRPPCHPRPNVVA